MPSHITESDLYGSSFATPEFMAIFNDRNRVQKWFDVEAALAAAQGALGMGADVGIVGRVTIERAGRMGDIVDMRQVMGALDGFITLDLKRCEPVDLQVLLFAQKLQRATDALGALGMARPVVFQAALVSDDVHGPPHCGVKRERWQSFGVAKER